MCVFDAIAQAGGKAFLDEYTEHVSGMQAQVTTRAMSIKFETWVLRAEAIAAAALDNVHPEAIAMCMPVIAAKEHRTPQRSEVRQALNNPLLGLGVNADAFFNAKVSRESIDRALAAFNPDFLRQQIQRDGLLFLHAAAKNANVPLATALIDRGVNPMAKDDRGWKVESHLKGSDKEQWRAYLSSRDAKSAIDAILNRPDRSGFSF